MEIIISNEAKNYITKKGKEIKITFESYHACGGWAPTRQISSRVPAVSTGKPVSSVQYLYKKYEKDGITIWIHEDIVQKQNSPIEIEFSKFLFFGELRLKGVTSIFSCS